ncbi:hypothetical protein DYBT9275_03491 [Dyadobacter sp. CECT 9275]|uniref:Uncharacterized protein n=1 Tax=Dyadobacter helix TaxID=2822344 RepID=A0A916NM85_9BACT|nr:hypothetical protein DYBT9275_03491 [Dyadobacter sp. CECT 9275]
MSNTKVGPWGKWLIAVLKQMIAKFKQSGKRKELGWFVS